jgi:phosphoribosyl 1,2-cyclic phosphodiesterase
MFSLRFWGVRGSVSVSTQDKILFGGHTSCVEIRVGKRLIIIDAGTGMWGLGNSLMTRNEKSLDADIFITHTHLDHIEGFPLFVPFFVKTNVFRIHGPTSYSGKSLKDALSAVFAKDFWPIGPCDMAATLEWHDLREGSYDMGDGLTVKTLLLGHPVPTFGYRFEYGGKSIGFISDHETYGAENTKVVSFLQDASLVVFDSQFTEEEYYKGKQGWGHSSFESAIETVERAGAKQTLVFFHHDPARTDEQLADLEKKYAKIANIKNVYAARENSVIEV